MNNICQTRRLLGTVVIAAYLSACTTMNPIVTTPSDMSSVLRVGDKVSIQEKNGTRHEFSVVRCTSDEICGPSECVQIPEISVLERQEFSAAKTTGLILGVWGAVALISIARAYGKFFGSWQ